MIVFFQAEDGIRGLCLSRGLGGVYKGQGLDVPEWLRSAALEKLLPAPLLATLVARPALSTYEARLTWVKTQMEHSRGVAQATAYGPGVRQDLSLIHIRRCRRSTPCTYRCAPHSYDNTHT